MSRAPTAVPGRFRERFNIRRRRPYVIWKVAATLDGRVAAADGSSRWITGEEARAAVHRLRATCDAVVVGSGTALADDPQLTVRGTEVARQPLRVVVAIGQAAGYCSRFKILACFCR